MTISSAGAAAGVTSIDSDRVLKVSLTSTIS